MTLVRTVTDEEVGELGRWWFRGLAEKVADRHNSGAEHLRPVEYLVKRRGRGLRRGFAVVAYQAHLEDQ